MDLPGKKKACQIDDEEVSSTLPQVTSARCLYQRHFQRLEFTRELQVRELLSFIM